MLTTESYCTATPFPTLGDFMGEDWFAEYETTCDSLTITALNSDEPLYDGEFFFLGMEETLSIGIGEYDGLPIPDEFYKKVLGYSVETYDGFYETTKVFNIFIED